MIDESLKNGITNSLDGNWAIMGIGNIMRGDDGFGSIVAQKIKSMIHDNSINARIIDAGDSPEMFVGKIQKLEAAKLLIIDAVFFEGVAGEIKIFNIEQLANPFSMTHGPSNFSFIKMLLPNCDIKILSVKPDCTDFGTQIGAAVSIAMNELIELISHIIDVQ